MAGIDRFNKQAATWDDNPYVVRSADLALEALSAFRPDLAVSRQGTDGTAAAGIDVLEVGCGTGILSLKMAPHVRSLVALDAAPGMIDVLRKKLSEMPHVTNVTPVCAVLEDPEDPALPAEKAEERPEGGPEGRERNTPRRQKFDLITSHLVLHHIADHAALLQTLYGCLKPGGQVALSDFEDFGPDARSFHPQFKMDGVEHHGTHAETFARLMREAGFHDVVVQPEWAMDKKVERFPGEWGDKMPPKGTTDCKVVSFPFLLCRGTKRDVEQAE